MLAVDEFSEELIGGGANRRSRLRVWGGRRRGLGTVLGGRPEGVMLLEPFADGAVDADVLAFLLRFNPLVSEDFIALSEEVFPEVAVGQRFRRFGGFGNRAGLRGDAYILRGPGWRS